jgi:hypothetical protein
LNLANQKGTGSKSNPPFFFQEVLRLGKRHVLYLHVHTVILALIPTKDAQSGSFGSKRGNGEIRTHRPSWSIITSQAAGAHGQDGKSTASQWHSARRGRHQMK